MLLGVPPHPLPPLAVTSDLEADLLTDPLAAVLAVRVRHDRQAFLLRDGPFPDVLQAPGATELLGEQRLELGTLYGAQ